MPRKVLRRQSLVFLSLNFAGVAIDRVASRGHQGEHVYLGQDMGRMRRDAGRSMLLVAVLGAWFLLIPGRAGAG